MSWNGESDISFQTGHAEIKKSNFRNNESWKNTIIVGWEKVDSLAKYLENFPI